MTVREAIKRADALRPNTLESEYKTKWLRALESEYAEVMGVELPVDLWPEDQTLLMPEPHDESYVWALTAYIDLANEESELYANDRITANAMIEAAKAWWRRHNAPPYRGNWRVM